MSGEERGLGKERSPWLVVGLSAATIGLYYLFWYYTINEEMRRHDPEVVVRPFWAVVAACVPVVNLISGYKTVARMGQMEIHEGTRPTTSPALAVLLLMFLGIGYPFYIAFQLREHWRDHSRVERLLTVRAE